MQDEITINGVTYVRKMEEKTNAEKLEEILKRVSQEMEVIEYEDYGLTATTRIASVMRTGNLITVIYDAGE